MQLSQQLGQHQHAGVRCELGRTADRHRVARLRNVSCQIFHFVQGSAIHHIPGYEMVASKLRPERAKQHTFHASSPQGEGTLAHAGRPKVVELLQDRQNTYTNTPEMKDAVTEMEKQNPNPVPAQLINQPGALVGVWKVFHAPHIATMSSFLFGTQFEPIIYRLGPENTISSNVKFSGPLGTGWLSAAGTYSTVYDASVEIKFDRFWVDWGGDDKLREDLVEPGSQAGSGYVATGVDQLITSVGRTFFFSEFAVFPVHYLDEDFVVFEFTPLESKIAARRVAHA